MQQVQIHPTQLDNFKSLAKNVTFHITKLTGKKSLSAFQRNDYLAIAFGYKGHSDLIYNAKQISQKQSSDALWVFKDKPKLKENFIQVFTNKLEYLDEAKAALVFDRIKTEEELQIRILHAGSNTMIDAPNAEIYSTISTSILFPAPSKEAQDYTQKKLEDFLQNFVNDEEKQRIIENKILADKLEEIISWHRIET